MFFHGLFESFRHIPFVIKGILFFHWSALNANVVRVTDYERTVFQRVCKLLHNDYLAFVAVSDGTNCL